MKNSSSRGLSLIELVAAIAIIMIMIALLLGVITRLRQQAAKVACANNLRQIGLAINTYASANQNLLPRSVDSNGLPAWLFDIQPHLSNVSVLICPSDNDLTEVAYLPANSPLAPVATFSPNVYAVATVTFIRRPCEGTDPPNTNYSSHPISIVMTCPQYTGTVVANSNTMWGPPGSSITGTVGASVSIGPLFNFQPSSMKLETVTIVSYGSVPAGTVRDVTFWVDPPKRSARNPYTNLVTGFYQAWAVQKDANTIRYRWTCTASEDPVYYDYGAFGSLYGGQDPSNMGANPANLDTWVNSESFTWNADCAWDVRVDTGSQSSQNPPPVTRMGSNVFRCSYAYNNIWDSVHKENATSRRIIVVEYGSPVAYPTTDAVNLIRYRHLGQRVNVLWIDGSVESMSINDVLSPPGGNTTFTSSIWGTLAP